MIFAIAALAAVCAYLAVQVHLRDRQIGRLLDANVGERRAHDGLVERVGNIHRREVAELHQARVEEVANLLQRIQAPEQAVATHVAEAALPDPPPVNLENDAELFEVYEERVRALGIVDG